MSHQQKELQEELLSIARRMAAELEDFCEAAKEAGCRQKKTENLVKEFDQYCQRNTSWQSALQEN